VLWGVWCITINKALTRQSLQVYNVHAALDWYKRKNILWSVSFDETIWYNQQWRDSGGENRQEALLNAHI